MAVSTTWGEVPSNDDRRGIEGWFGMYIGNMVVELWFGNKWVKIDWGKR